MIRYIIGIIIGIVGVLSWQKSVEAYRKPLKDHVEHFGDIQQQIAQVSKLVVTEAQFSDIVSYSDVKTYYSDWISSEKKALVLVQAKVNLSYNLSELVLETDTETKTITIVKIPEPQIQTSPKIEYYNLDSGYLNTFNTEDHNQVQQLVQERLTKQIEASSLKENGSNRLISELYNLMDGMGHEGWRILYHNEPSFKEKS